jgi:hypothetical protein
MNYTFPEIKTIRSTDERILKILEEISEFREKPSDEEAIDIFHACETFIRGYFQGRELDLDKTINFVKTKNYFRKYYEEQCY